jgi:hypothetical protein
LLTVLAAQTVGGYSAFRIANGLWFYTLDYSSDHAHLYKSLPCAIQYKVSGVLIMQLKHGQFKVAFIYAFAFEVVGCFILRLMIVRIPEAYKRFVVPVVFASFLAFGK